MIQLSQRLRAVAGLVQGQGVLADIGTDHGYIPIYLIQTGQVQRAIASDIGKGPLMRAQEHIHRCGLAEYIETRLTSGAIGYQPKEAQTFVIAGMGGGLMKQIMMESPEVFAYAQEIILQPQSEQDVLRKYVVQQGYRIVEEDMVEEDGKYYPMMRIIPKHTASEDESNPYTNPTEADWIYGGWLLRHKHPILQKYMEKEKTRYQKLLTELRALPHQEKVAHRVAELEAEYAWAKEAYERVSQ